MTHNNLIAERFSKVKRMTHSEELPLIKAAKQGCQKSRDSLVKANISFAVNIAYKFHNSDDDIDDYIQAAVLGLCKSIDHYRLDSGVKLFTCAVWYIKAEVIELKNMQDNILRLPHNLFSVGFKLYKYMTEIPENQIDLHYFADIVGLPYTRILRVKNTILPRDRFDESELQTEKTQIADYSFIKNERSEEIKKAIKNLDLREQFIINCYYFAEFKCLSMSEIGGLLNLTREYVRLIRNGALKKIKKILVAKDLV